jgi:hypothetical protein
MTERFLCSDAQAGDMSFGDVESILDALEAALVSAETPLFDAARQSWQPVGLHPEVRSAWEARERYRPPGGSRLMLPALPAPSAVELDDITLRRAAYAGVHGSTGSRPPDEPPGRRRGAFAVILLGGLLMLGVVGWLVVSFAVKLSAFAAGLYAVSNKR